MATALELSRRLPRQRVLVLEKEGALAAHQTGNNSGVIHSGIYYKPGSLKARNCVAGARALMEFCQENDVGYELCGKVIVATEERELPALHELHRRGTANGVPGLELVGPERLRELEPHTRGVQALWSPNTGIIDYRQVTEAYGRRFQENGGEVWTDARVLRIRATGDGHVLSTRRGDVQARYLINCAGLYADAVARMLGVRLPVRIIPFRGEYYFLAPEARSLVRGLIYPVPDPRFPFLGVHFTRTVHGEVEAGPNAVLAFAREGYSMGRVHPGELWGTLAYPGLLGHVAPPLAHGADGGAPVAEQGRVHAVAAAAGTGGGGAAPGAGRRGRSGAGRRPGRGAGGRLPHQRDAERHPRAQRALAGSDGLAVDREGHRRHGGEVLRAGGVRRAR